MHTLVAVIVALLLAEGAAAQKAVSFPTEDGGVVYADVYGEEGDRGIVLAHGGRFNKESWQEQARALAAAKFRVLIRTKMDVVPLEFRCNTRSSRTKRADHS